MTNDDNEANDDEGDEDYEKLQYFFIEEALEKNNAFSIRLRMKYLFNYTA